MSVAARLEELGITLPEGSPPLALYRPAVRSGDHVYVSGQVALANGAILHPGVVGDTVSLAQAREAARICAINALGAANALLGNLDGVRVLRLAGFVAATPLFADHPQVINAASELLRDVFGEDAGMGTRIAVGVASLPARSPVEVELVLETR